MCIFVGRYNIEGIYFFEVNTKYIYSSTEGTCEENIYRT